MKTKVRFFVLPYLLFFLGASSLRAETTPLVQNPFWNNLCSIPFRGISRTLLLFLDRRGGDR